MAKKRKAPAERSYARLTRHERNSIERMLDRGKGAREIARELGRSPSTVANEVARHRFVTAPRSRYGEQAPADLSGACGRLQSWPRGRNGCKHRRGYGCGRRPRVFYSARMAQAAADAELRESRRGIDETEASVAAKLSTIRSRLARGLSPQQVAALHPELGLSASTACRWVDAGYAEMTNLDLRRKVGYKKRSRKAPRRRTAHSARRSHGEFGRLPEDVRASAWEMDTVEGRQGDSARLLTLYHRPTSSQLAIPMADGTCASALAGLGLVRDALGEDESESAPFPLTHGVPFRHDAVNGERGHRMGHPSPEYSAEFKQQAVGLHRERGGTYAEIARELGVDAGSIVFSQVVLSRRDCGGNPGPNPSYATSPKSLRYCMGLL